MNIDTDLQFAFAEGIRDYMIKTLTIWKLKSVTQKVLMFQTKNITIKKMDAWKRNDFQRETRAICRLE
jgi:fructose/tagatose bisphosphate aldolase